MEVAQVPAGFIRAVAPAQCTHPRPYHRRSCRCTRREPAGSACSVDRLVRRRCRRSSSCCTNANAPERPKARAECRNHVVPLLSAVDRGGGERWREKSWRLEPARQRAAAINAGDAGVPGRLVSCCEPRYRGSPSRNRCTTCTGRSRSPPRARRPRDRCSGRRYIVRNKRRRLRAAAGRDAPAKNPTTAEQSRRPHGCLRRTILSGTQFAQYTTPSLSCRAT
jgi:hypothetical protein